ncbi:hypothetical protein D3C86_1414050 [compost metagenome]
MAGSGRRSKRCRGRRGLRSAQRVAAAGLGQGFDTAALQQLEQPGLGMEAAVHAPRVQSCNERRVIEEVDARQARKAIQRDLHRPGGNLEVPEHMALG